ncbi:MAG TPA: Omp28-related outer membrane protein [Candidatus Kapabacteria bacterium]|nr:Omp28-related outer membrane protein [Candidatus Kapabacteria bacterium]
MKTRTAFFLLLAACFFVPSLLAPSLRAQLVPHTVLVEEGTNWGCPPCAAYNPGVESFLNQHEGSVIHLAYHPDWPSATDPMYLNDPTENMDRVVSYYGINGVPAVALNGCHTFVPAYVSQLEATFDSCAGVMSPVALTVSRTVNGLTVSVHVSIHPVADLSAYTKLHLRVAAAETFVPGPGPNGEKQYIHVMRQMMPNDNGTLVHLGTGDTSFDFSYTLKPAYNAANMYEVAFLQSDVDHNVLQAATDQPELILTPQSSAELVQRTSSSTADLPFTLSSTFSNSTTATVKFYPTSSAVWPITVNGTALAGSQSISLSGNQSQSLDVNVSIGSGAYMSGILAVSTLENGETLVASYPIKVISPAAKVAFVDVMGDSAGSSYTLATLDQLNVPYVPLSSNEAASISGWSATTFPEMVVVANKWIITGNDKGRVSQYLQSGGHLFVTGGEIAYGLADPNSTPADRDENFLENTLRATYVRDSAGPHTVHGVSNDPITGTFAGTNINIYAQNVDALNGGNQPDEIKPANGSSPIFYYGTAAAQCGGIRWDSAGSMLAYLSFGLQNLAAPDRASITTAIFNWFESASAVSGPSDASFALEPNYPNPFGNSTWLTYTLAKSGPVRISIVDARGMEVAVAADQFQNAGFHTVNLETKALMPGAYFAILRTAEGSCIRAMSKE